MLSRADHFFFFHFFFNIFSQLLICIRVFHATIARGICNVDCCLRFVTQFYLGFGISFLNTSICLMHGCIRLFVLCVMLCFIWVFNLFSKKAHLNLCLYIYTIPNSNKFFHLSIDVNVKKEAIFFKAYFCDICL